MKKLLLILILVVFLLNIVSAEIWEGLVNYWNMNEISGTNALDITGAAIGNQRNITFIGNSEFKGSGIIGNGIYLDGDDDYGDTSFPISALTGTGDFAVALWFNSTEAKTGVLWSIEDGTFNHRVAFHAEAIFLVFLAGASSGDLSGGLTTDGSKWEFLLVQRKSGRILVYQNTTLLANMSGEGSLPSANFRFGSNGVAPLPGSDDFKGMIDEVGVWNRALITSEIAQLWNNGSGISYEVDTIPPNTTQPEITPTEPKTTDNLQCHATLTDDKQINLIANWTWYKNDIVNISGSTPVDNGTYTNITTLSSAYTTKGESWKCEVLPFDGYNYGTAKNSSSVTILNTAPNHSQPLLSTPSGKNFSYENLTCYNKSTSDVDNDAVTNIYNWYKNSQPFSVLNMPFENSTRDYSGYGNNGTIYGASFIQGKQGRALSFDGIDDYVSVPDSNSLDFINKKSWEIWFKRASFNTLQILFDKTNGGTNYRLALKPDNKLEFSYFIPPALTLFVWLTNTKTEFDLGIYDRTYWNGSAITLNVSSAEQQIFFDGFESGTFSTYGWTISGPGAPWVVSNETPYEGIYHTRAKQTGAGTRTVLETNVSTVGFHNINFSFYVQRVGLDPADDFSVYYFNGTSWKTLESSAGNPADDPNYMPHSYILSDDANNNPNLKIRFNCTAGAISEWCNVDNVKIKGNDTAFYDNGNYTSKIFDAGDISEWKNLSWIKTLPINTNLTFQIRSCNDSLCIGEIFVGPDNTANTNFSNSEFNNISFIANNRYFQYKAYFSTSDMKKSSGLYSVSVSYVRNVTDGLITLTSTTAITDTNWYQVAITFDDAILTNNFILYLNGILETSNTEHRLATMLNNDLYIGKRYPENDSFFNGIIDEVRVYNYALTQEQISNNYLLNYYKIVSQETNVSDNWMCQVTPNDAENDGLTLNSSTAEIYWAITFNVRDSYSNVSLNGVIISCNYSGFNQAPYTTNPYGPYGFPPGNWECVFVKYGYYDKTITFDADNDTIISVKMSEQAEITIEEHTWLEAIYNCIILKDCDLYNLLLEMNQTIGNIWEHTKPTDQSVVTFRNITNKVVDSEHNLTIDYNVNIPIKAGYVSGTYLPVRIGYWFLNTSNTTCYNQGDKPTGVEDPYCQPLIIETLGPMGGSVSFTTKLLPSLPAGEYSIKEMVDIDPNNVWINYGQEVIGTILVTKIISDYGISLEKTGEIMPRAEISSGSSVSSGASSSNSGGTKTIVEREIIKLVPQEETSDKDKTDNDEIIHLNKPTITGGVIGTNLLSGGGFIIVIAILCVTFIIFIIITSKTVLRLKKK